MIANNHLVQKLYDALQEDLQIRNRHVRSRANRYHMSILENEILDRKQSVVFLYRITEHYAFLEFYCPLAERQHKRLSKSK